MGRKLAVLIMAAALAAAAPLPGCGGEASPDDEGGSGGGINTPVQAIDKADDVAKEVEQRAKETEVEIDKQLEQLP